MLKSLASLFTGNTRQLTARQLEAREWSRLLATATSQNERDEINDMFSGSYAA